MSNISVVAQRKSILKPQYICTIGSEEFVSENNSNIISFQVFRGMGLPTDSCSITLKNDKKYDFKKDEELKIKIGYDTPSQVVFSGLITNIEQDFFTIRVTGIGFALRLLRLRLNRVYLNQTAGKIVSAIVQEANLKTKKTSDGVTLPCYVIDELKNCYEHIIDLAKRCNFNVYLEDNQLTFKEAEGGNTIPLSFGKDIIQIGASNFSSFFEGIKVIGESPSSFRGSDTSHWLTKQDVKGEAGTNTIKLLQDSTIKDKETAQSVADSNSAKLKCTYGVSLVVVGAPEIKMGDTVNLENLPFSGLSTPLEVRSYEHFLSKTKGFTTTINCLVRSGAK
jgi:hypothetical protein